MAKYNLKVFGWAINAYCHSFKDEEVKHIREYQKKHDNIDIDELISGMTFGEHEELSNNLNGFDLYEPNMWVLYKLCNNGDNYFRVEDDKENLVLEFYLKKMPCYSDINEDFENTAINATPEKGKKENIIIHIEEHKGEICNYYFDSEGVPAVKDFSFTDNCIFTPDDEYEFVENIFFKGKELEMDFESASNMTKYSVTELFTLEK